ncbi:acyltransferase [Pseudoramibacter alactolyticus]|jgi:surface polysaccharide O-acyltransferase-like enzyme|uniref:acyltransferase n=1 Tax=Pseudoramibacter alactolyticus TaxID=113287 RepID=UPI002356CE8E|nr:acyltransferase [Pseudoramibacter alactolyticus]MBM6969331.1 acyltransferase [Pseudoramibacter alactolyticus]
MEKPKDISYISFASVISAIGVVYLHTNGCFWQFSKTANYWPSANIIECVFYFAVPVFFMISGATLMDFYERYDLKTYAKKRIHKTVIPYLFWSIFGLLFQIFTLKSIDPAGVGITFIVKGLLTGKLVAIYWFFVPLFSIYLCLPLFAAVPKERRIKLFSFLAIAALLLNVLLPFALSLYGAKDVGTFSVGVGAGYLIYIMLGYLLTRIEIPRRWRFGIYGLGLIGLLMHIIGTYRLSMAAGQIVSTYKGYINVPCVLYSVAVFVFFRYAGTKWMAHKGVNKIVEVLSKYTFSLYLLHWYVLQVIVKVLGFNSYSLLFRLIVPLLILGIVVIIVNILRKVCLMDSLLP